MRNKYLYSVLPFLKECKKETQQQLEEYFQTAPAWLMAVSQTHLDVYKRQVIAVQPVRGLDVGAIEYIHKQLIAQRDAGKAVLLVSLEPVSYTHLLSPLVFERED